jgi:signal transduction histidine kinase
MMTAAKTEDHQGFPAIDATLLRIAVVFRVVGAGWLILLAILTLVTEPSQIDPGTRNVLVLSAIGIAVVWTAATVILMYRRPKVLQHVAFLAFDVALAVWTAVTPSLTQSDTFFAGGFPISSPLLIATTRGMVATLLPATLVAASSVIGVRFANARAAEVLAINLLAPIVVAWGFGTIREQDRQRRLAEEALALERTKVARADERAEMAAHLHDSVLQTLALIQRRAKENRGIVRVARRQERELRAWLNGGPPLSATNMLSGALIRAAEAVEDEHDVFIELSTAGDTTLDDRTTGLILAAREAMKNAARFAGVEKIYVLAEIVDDGVRVVVRDQGAGFDPSAIPEDRRGIRESITGRLDRLGGTASIRSSVGDGTEVELYVGEAT